MNDPVTLDDVKFIIQLIRDADNVAEFTLKYGDLEISLSREGAATGRAAQAASAGAVEPPAPPPPRQPAPATPPVPPPAAAPAAGMAAPAADEVVVKAPMVGTFYRAPKPGEPPFVEVGQAVTATSVLCIIEVMKLMNSLQAGVDGTVTRILVDDAQAVEYGQALVYIRPSA